MNSKEIEQAILNKLQSGEKMEDILEEIAATANKINAQREAEAATEKKYELIRKGPMAYLKQLQWDETAVTEDVLCDILASYLLTTKEVSSSFKNTDDIAELLEICHQHIQVLPTIINFAKEAADLLTKNIGEAEYAVSATPAILKPKCSHKDDFDVVKCFLKDNGLL